MHSSDFVVMKILVVLFFVIHSRKHKYLSLWKKKNKGLYANGAGQV